MKKNKLARLINILLLAIFFSGCGGGGKNGSSVINDTTAPEITLSTTKNPLFIVLDPSIESYGGELIVHNEIENLSVKAIDDVSGEVEVEVFNSVNYKQPGDYEIVYTAQDEAGNISSKTLNVIVTTTNQYPYWTKDQALQNCIHSQLDISKYAHKPSVEVLNSIKSLECLGGSPTDDTNRTILDYSALVELKNIKNLNLSEQSQLNDISFLSKLKLLEKLILNSTKGTTDLSVLSNNTKLYHIDIENSSMVNSESLQILLGLTNLKYLNIKNR